MKQWNKGLLLFIIYIMVINDTESYWYLVPTNWRIELKSDLVNRSSGSFVPATY